MDWMDELGCEVPMNRTWYFRVDAASAPVVAESFKEAWIKVAELMPDDWEPYSSTLIQWVSVAPSGNPFVIAHTA